MSAANDNFRMTNYQSIMLQLLRDELWQAELKDYDLSPEDCSKVLHYAKEQSLLGLVLNTLVRNNVKMGIQNVTKGLMVMETIRKGNALINANLKEMADILNANNIHYVVFKGQAVGIDYPNPDLRAAGDVDFYVVPDQYNHAYELLAEAFGLKKEDLLKEDKHDSFEYKKTAFEMHFEMETFGSKKHQRYYNSVFEKSIGEERGEMDFHGTRLLVLEPTLNVIQVFKHLTYHLLVEGVGLRQFCDLAIIIHKHKDEIDRQQLETHLKKIGYYKAFIAVGALLVNHLGLKKDDFPFDIPDKYGKWADKILEVTLQRGNFGKFNRKHYKPGFKRSMETARIAMGHCFKFLPLAKSDILHLIPKRIGIALKLYKTHE